MKIERDGKTYELTAMEMFQAYFEQERLFYIEDAKMFLENELGDDNEYVKKKYGRSIQNFLNDQSLLEVLVDTFMDKHDCNYADNDQWENLVAAELHYMREEYQKEKAKRIKKSCHEGVQKIS